MKFDPILLRRTREGLAAAGKTYIKPTDTICHSMKWIIYIGSAWAIFYSLIMIVSHMMQLGNESAIYSVGEIARLKNGITVSIFGIALLILGIIFVAIKKHIAGGALLSSGSLGLIAFYVYIYSDSLAINRLGSVFFTRHGIPLTLILVPSILLMIWAIHCNKTERDAYVAFTDRLYYHFKERAKNLSDDNPEAFDLSENEWQKFIIEYSNESFAPEKLKRSRKQKLNKENE